MGQQRSVCRLYSIDAHVRAGLPRPDVGCRCRFRFRDSNSTSDVDDPRRCRVQDLRTARGQSGISQGNPVSKNFQKIHLNVTVRLR